MKLVNLETLRNEIPILELATKLGLAVTGHQARCFNSEAHKNGDRSPSLGFDTTTNRFKCFSCGIKGSTIDLYMRVRGVSLTTAIEELQAKPTYHRFTYSTPLPQAKKPTGDDCQTYELFTYLFCQLDKEATDYLTGEERGLSLETIKRFEITAIPDYSKVNQCFKDLGQERLQPAGLYNTNGNLIFYRHKVIIPFLHRGRVVFLQGRALDKEHPKYLNLTGMEKPIFNLEVLDTLTPGDRVYICEGVFDCMRLSQEGYNAVAILGVTDFKPQQVALFKRFKVTLALDNDMAGQQLAEQIASLFIKQRQEVEIKQLPAGVKDISDYFNRRNYG